MIPLEPTDVHGTARRGIEFNLAVFAVDISGSMTARDRLATVTSAVTSLLRDVY